MTRPLVAHAPHIPLVSPSPFPSYPLAGTDTHKHNATHAGEASPTEHRSSLDLARSEARWRALYTLGMSAADTRARDVTHWTQSPFHRPSFRILLVLPSSSAPTLSAAQGSAPPTAVVEAAPKTVPHHEDAHKQPRECHGHSLDSGVHSNRCRAEAAVCVSMSEAQLHKRVRQVEDELHAAHRQRHHQNPQQHQGNREADRPSPSRPRASAVCEKGGNDKKSSEGGTPHGNIRGHHSGCGVESKRQRGPCQLDAYIGCTPSFALRSTTAVAEVPAVTASAATPSAPSAAVLGASASQPSTLYQ